jgi:hypothetical protein
VVPALVQINGLPWIVYVDGIDGTVTGEMRGGICD